MPRRFLDTRQAVVNTFASTRISKIIQPNQAKAMIVRTKATVKSLIGKRMPVIASLRALFCWVGNRSFQPDLSEQLHPLAGESRATHKSHGDHQQLQATLNRRDPRHYVKSGSPWILRRGPEALGRTWFAI